MYHQAVFRARKGLEDWTAQHLPILCDDVQSADAADMVISLGRLIRFTQIQLSAMNDQWSQDAIAQQKRDSEEQM